MLVFFIMLTFVLSFFILMVEKLRYVSSNVPTQPDPNALGAIHWGLLNGGRSRAALAAFTQWLVDDTLVWNEAERQYELGKTETDDPTLTLVNAGAPMKQILQTLENNLVPYERDLQSWGLWCEDEAWKKRSRKLHVAWIVYTSGILAYSLWELVQDKSLPSFWTWIIISGIQLQRKLPQKTREGHKMLKKFKRDHPFKIGETPEALLPTAVAIDGVNALYDSYHAPLIWVLATQP